MFIPRPGGQINVSTFFYQSYWYCWCSYSRFVYVLGLPTPNSLKHAVKYIHVNKFSCWDFKMDVTDIYSRTWLEHTRNDIVNFIKYWIYKQCKLATKHIPIQWNVMFILEIEKKALHPCMPIYDHSLVYIYDLFVSPSPGDHIPVSFQIMTNCARYSSLHGLRKKRWPQSFV